MNPEMSPGQVVMVVIIIFLIAFLFSRAERGPQ
jgi:hypothetical protein